MKKIILFTIVALFLGNAPLFAAEAKKTLTLEDAEVIVLKAYPDSKVLKKEKERGLLEVYIQTPAGEKIAVKVSPKDGEIVSPKQPPKEEKTN